LQDHKSISRDFIGAAKKPKFRWLHRPMLAIHLKHAPRTPIEIIASVFVETILGAPTKSLA
jgi:hypothetical protein